jgi:hypothetical protein
MTSADTHEEGRKAGLAQAAAYLRGEVAKMRLRQKDDFAIWRVKAIDKLARAARVVGTLK